MNLREKAQYLASISLFSGQSDDTLLQIAKYFQTVFLSPKSLFIVEDTVGDNAYFIVSGLVRVFHSQEAGKDITVNFRTHGDIVGELALIEDSVRSANVETIEESILLSIDKESFHLLLQAFPQVSLNFLKLLSQRLREDLRIQITKENSQLSDRAYDLLKKLADHYPDADIPFSHEELSAFVNATQPRVTEALNLLRSSQKISLSRRKIRLLN
jgi:CRP-like cAMP-binding protein